MRQSLNEAASKLLVPAKKAHKPWITEETRKLTKKGGEFQLKKNSEVALAEINECSKAVRKAVPAVLGWLKKALSYKIWLKRVTSEKSLPHRNGSARSGVPRVQCLCLKMVNLGEMEDAREDLETVISPMRLEVLTLIPKLKN